MISIDSVCSAKLLVLLDSVEPVIPSEWQDVIQQLINQLQTNVCEESTVILVLSLIKKQLKNDEDKAWTKIDSDKAEKLKEEQKEIINILSCLLIQPQNEVFNSIRR